MRGREVAGAVEKADDVAGHLGVAPAGRGSGQAPYPALPLLSAAEADEARPGYSRRSSFIF